MVKEKLKESKELLPEDEGSIVETLLANIGFSVEVKDRVRYMNGKKKIPRIQRGFDWLRAVKRRIAIAIGAITLYKVIRSLTKKRRRNKKNGRTRR